MNKIELNIKEKERVLSELKDFLKVFEEKKEYFEKFGIKINISSSSQ